MKHISVINVSSLLEIFGDVMVLVAVAVQLVAIDGTSKRAEEYAQFQVDTRLFNIHNSIMTISYKLDQEHARFRKVVKCIEMQKALPPGITCFDEGVSGYELPSDIYLSEFNSPCESEFTSQPKFFGILV